VSRGPSGKVLARNWKFSEADVAQREHWHASTRADDDATRQIAWLHAPWGACKRAFRPHGTPTARCVSCCRGFMFPSAASAQGMSNRRANLQGVDVSKNKSRHSLMIGVVITLLACPACSEEDPPPPPVQAPTKAADPVSIDSPDKLFPELGEAYAECAKVLKRFYDSGGQDAPAWADAFTLECKQLSLIVRSNAMLAAHPEWKDISRQWYDSSVKQAAAGYRKQATRFSEVMGNKSRTRKGEQEAAERFNTMNQKASEYLASIDPSMKAKFDQQYLAGPASSATRQEANKARTIFAQHLGLQSNASDSSLTP